jgi:hypothetical protein
LNDTTIPALIQQIAEVHRFLMEILWVRPTKLVMIIFEIQIFIYNIIKKYIFLLTKKIFIILLEECIA